MEKAVVVDIEGTLSDPTHRMHYIKGGLIKKWPQFFKSFKDDKVHLWCKKLLENLPVKKILLTGRPENYRNITEEWLKENDISYDILLMRKKGDFRKDFIAKKELFEKHIKDKYEVIFAIDDQPQIIEMWESLDIPALKVQEV